YRCHSLRAVQTGRLRGLAPPRVRSFAAWVWGGFARRGEGLSPSGVRGFRAVSGGVARVRTRALLGVEALMFSRKLGPRLRARYGTSAFRRSSSSRTGRRGSGDCERGSQRAPLER